MNWTALSNEMASCVVSIVDIKDTIKDMSTVFIQVISLHLTWLALFNDMVTCVANIVDVEDDITDLQLIFMQVISVNLYCCLTLLHKQLEIHKLCKFSNTLTINIFQI